MCCWALKMGRRLPSTSCACWCDGCTFSPGYEMLCICFKAARSNLSPAAGQSTTISLRWYIPSRAAVIIITVGKILQYVECIAFARRCTHFRGKKLNSRVLDYKEKRRGFGGVLATQQACAFWLILFSWFSDISLCLSHYEIFLHAKLRILGFFSKIMKVRWFLLMTDCTFTELGPAVRALIKHLLTMVFTECGSGRESK